ncbi:hypothetical protein OOT46_18005 [Aquabacterium sp. A7-Y]|uniref:hypothetical protein n=1 Tax=Aquabacterium sp. A7-Y TaxID=1349605 RepID=UPI00223D7855|nr:hypothetical protein [Aquabacterium sp. A7-Y]MCW7539734.1 hypothetical protein [Aquabacterium sp. A7-Y]
MPLRRFLVALCLACPALAAAEGRLTEAETRWLDAAMPVLEAAREQGLPLDVAVQAQPQPGASPVAMGYAGGRCKLVLAMRGNAQADTLLAGVPPHLETRVIEAMTAHELGHCWRYVRGAWNTLPDGFMENVEDDSEPARQWRDMRRTRREEGYADLVGLAWTLKHHPKHYAEVHTWLAGVRAHPEVPGSHHDTRAWVRLAVDPGVFPSSGSAFERAWTVWLQGLAAPDE